MSKTEPGVDWPPTSSPSQPPTVVWYFSQLIDGEPQPMMATGFRHRWQAGTFLRAVLVGSDKVVNGNVVDYEFEAERVEFRGKLVGCTVDEALASARNVDIPRHEHQWVQWSRGVKRAAPPPIAATPPVNDAPDVPKPPSVPRVARSTSAITLAAMCAEHKVEPKAVRVELRRAKMERPEAGWEFEDGDPRIGQVLDIIKGMKP